MFHFLAHLKLWFLQLKDVAGSLFELWNLMDTPKEEKVCFLRITSILGSSESEIVQPGALSVEVIEQVWKQHKLPTCTAPYPRVVEPRLSNF